MRLEADGHCHAPAKAKGDPGQFTGPVSIQGVYCSTFCDQQCARALRLRQPLRVCQCLRNPKFKVVFRHYRHLPTNP